MPTYPIIVGGIVAAIAIAGATVAVCLGHIDSATFVAVVGTFGGVVTGAGAHASGVTQGKPTPPAGPQ